MALRIIKKAKVKMAVATRYGFVAWDCDKVWHMLGDNVCGSMDCFTSVRNDGGSESPRNDKKERRINGNTKL